MQLNYKLLKIDIVTRMRKNRYQLHYAKFCPSPRVVHKSYGQSHFMC